MVIFRRQSSVAQVDGGLRSAASTFAVFRAGGSTTPREPSAVETVGASFGFAGAVVELAGAAGAPPGATVEIVGAIYELGGAAVELTGATLEYAGTLFELTGKPIEVVVRAIETTRLGAIVEFFGIALAIGGAAPHIADAAFEIADASLFRAAFELVDVAVEIALKGAVALFEIAVPSSSSDQPERIARSIVPHMYVLSVRLMSYTPNHTLVPSLLLISHLSIAWPKIATDETNCRTKQEAIYR